MTLDPIAAVRRWVGSQPDDVDLWVTLDQYGEDPDRAALHILRVRYADMVANPAKWAVVDDYSQDGTANLAFLRAQIARLEAIVGEAEPDPWGFSSTPICGPGVTR